MRAYKKLDPHLRRLVSAADMPSGLEIAREMGEIASSSPTPSPETSTKRVLIEVNTSEPLDISSIQLNRIAGDIYTAELPVSQLVELAQLSSIESIEAGRRWYPLLDSSLPETKADVVHNGIGGSLGRTGKGVLVGIIDFGMDFTLDDFRNSDGTTRLAFLWDQSLSADAGERTPRNFNYGVEYSAAEIDQALRMPDPFTVIRHHRGIASHGTHVAGTAVGNGRSRDPLNKSPVMSYLTH